MSHRFYSLVVTVVIHLPISIALVSCATDHPSYTRNPRIIERNLVAEVVQPQLPFAAQPAPTASGATIEPTGTEGVIKSSSAAIKEAPLALDRVYFVQFDNESAVLQEGAIPLDSLIPAVTESTHVLVVGQSHGPSVVGTNRLAVQRADAVARALRATSIDPTRIHTVAAWSKERLPYGPSRGVQIILLDDASQEWQSLMMLPVGLRTAS